ncbi:MAG: FAD:protein FMN transferase [bacterium]
MKTLQPKRHFYQSQITLSIENFDHLIGNPDYPSNVFFSLVITLFLCLFSILFVSCSKPDSSGRIYQRTQFLMGTLVEVKAVTNDPNVAYRAIENAFEKMREIEDLMTAKRPGSLVARIGQDAVERAMKIPDELFDVIETCQRYAMLTQGSFDISVAPVTGLWFFDRPMETIPKKEDVRDALKLVGFQGILLDQKTGSIKLERKGMGLDLGGGAKGYAVDEAVNRLKELGIKAGIVNAGGDLKVFGSKPGGIPWNIGIQDPEYSDRIMGSIVLTDTALVTSGDYERFIVYEGIKYHHIIDPKTGWPARGCKSVSIQYHRAFDADILSTAIFVLGPEKGMTLLERLPGVEGMIVDASGRIDVSSGWKDKLKLQKTPIS